MQTATARKALQTDGWGSENSSDGIRSDCRLDVGLPYHICHWPRTGLLLAEKRASWQNIASLQEVGFISNRTHQSLSIIHLINLANSTHHRPVCDHTSQSV